MLEGAHAFARGHDQRRSVTAGAVGVPALDFPDNGTLAGALAAKVPFTVS